MKFSELLKKIIDRGVAVGEVHVGANPEIRGVCEDSRKVKAGDLFVARGGTKTSGEKFIADALSRGAVALVVENEIPAIAITGPHKAPSARVANINLACALLAHEVAGNPSADMKVVGITGTKGKTTVAYLLRAVLKAAGHIVGMIGTVEIDDGKTTTAADMTTPGSVDLVELFCRMKQNGVTHCVMEVSSHALHQHRVAGIDFAVAIFTNLTGDHLDYHKTMEEYAAAKAMLFEGLRKDAVAVVNNDDSYANRMTSVCPARVANYRVGNHFSGSEVGVYLWEMTQSGIRFQFHYPGGDTEFESPLVGRHNAYNLAAVITAAGALGVSYDDNFLYKVIASSTGAPGRLDPVVPLGMLRAQLPFQIFVDYAHTHDSLENVLVALRATMGAGRLISLFGCGGDRDRIKRPKMAAIAERLADLVFVTSDNPRTENPAAIIEEICAGFSPNWQAAGKITIEPDRRAAIRAAIASAKQGDVVLLAGKGHENYQIIGTTKHHFDDVEEAQTALRALLQRD